MKRLLAVFVFLSLLAPGSLAHAQGVQTGTITGVVQSGDGLSIPGTTVTVSSPSLQGERTTVTDVNGVYFLRGLPSGTYTVHFEIQGFQPADRRDVQVPVGGTVEVTPVLQIAGRTETVTVVGESPSPLATVTAGAIYTKRDLDALPVGRTPARIAELAPGLTNNTPNAGQVTISGGFAYDNVFMINGVDVNDNLFGTAHNLFIEDAIQETNILTSGISAEYGRFSGGVINMITKSGGNTFTGSFRDTLTNPKWIEETPREKSNNVVHQDILGKVYEGTLGGPILRDRLWFFAAGRHEKSSTPNTFVQTGGGYTTQVLNKRVELKGTGTVAPSQTLQASYINNPTEQANTSGLSPTLLLSKKMLVNRQLPNRLFAGNYNGVLANRYFVTAQYSEKKFGFRNSGGTSTAIADSPFRTRGVAAGVPGSLFFNAPYFDSTDPENRNNRQITGSVGYLFSSKRFGTHDLKGGAEHYIGTRTGGNSQTATGYVFRADYLVQGAAPVLDGNGDPIPIFVPGTSRLENWLALRGAKVNIKTTSLYLQDRWVATPKLTLELGTRFEAVRSNATGDITTVDTRSIVPRLGATFDVEGNGRTVVQATYAHYAGKYSEGQFARNTEVGNPSLVIYRYDGPAGQGINFAPGMNPANYTTIIGGSFPTANIQNASGLKSPLTREATLGAGRRVGQKGFAKATYTFRRWTDFVDDFIDLSNGTVSVRRSGTDFGTFTNVVYNNTDFPKREYQGLVLQGTYRAGERATVGASYTAQLKNDGSFEGEAANQPGNASIYGDYPEILGPALSRYLPEGHLADFQRHKLRMYGTYTQPLGRFGSLDLSPLWRVNSATTYSLTAGAVPLTAIELARNPGYPANDINTSTAYTLYFGDLGQNFFKGYGLLDLSATYSIPTWKSARPWVKFEVYNVLNNDKQIAWDRTVTADPNSARDANGLPTGYIQGPRFGQATADNQFAQPLPGINGGRLFQMALGLRF